MKSRRDCLVAAVCAALGLSPLASVPKVLAAEPPPPPPVVLPPVNVTASKPQTLKEIYQRLNHEFEGPFPELRNGEMIEALLWRHSYLQKHPQESAIIVTDRTGDRLRWAATVYTDQGKVYASNIALGERELLDGAHPSDLTNPLRVAEMRRAIDLAQTNLEPGSISSRVAEAEANDDYQAFLSAGNQAPILKDMIASGDGPPQTVGGVEFAKALSGKQVAMNMMMEARYDARLDRVRAMVDGFGEPAEMVLEWAFQALHDQARAGLVPVALGELDMGKAPDSGVHGEGRFASEAVRGGVMRAMAFDWDGVQYLYHPDIGTLVRPLPRMLLTGLPHLCVKNGALLEADYFATAYSRAQLSAQVVVVPDAPPGDAFEMKGSVAFYLPQTGICVRTTDPSISLGNVDSLRLLRKRLMSKVSADEAQEGKRSTPPPTPDGMPGDDADMQIRRVYLAFSEIGIPCELKPGNPETLEFQWGDRKYRYGPDQVPSPVLAKSATGG